MDLENQKLHFIEVTLKAKTTLLCAVVARYFIVSNIMQK